MLETHAQPPVEARTGPHQKLVRISGQSSMLMTGDDTYPRSRDDVLPRLLVAGWRITSVAVGSDGNGYTVIER